MLLSVARVLCEAFLELKSNVLTYDDEWDAPDGDQGLLPAESETNGETSAKGEDGFGVWAETLGSSSVDEGALLSHCARQHTRLVFLKVEESNVFLQNRTVEKLAYFHGHILAEIAEDVALADDSEEHGGGNAAGVDHKLHDFIF